MKRLLTALLTIALVATTLAACNGGGTQSSPSTSGSQQADVSEAAPQESELPVLRVAVMPFLNSIPIQYMIENGLDKENGFQIETVFFPTGGPMNEALGSDLWDVGTLSAASVYSLATYGAYVVADIGHSEGGIETLVNADSPIAAATVFNPTYPDILGSPETLADATIAVPTGTLSQLNVNKWLEKLGLTPEDVNIVHMEFPQAYQALLAGQCDVAALNPPTSYAAEDAGMVVTSSLTNLDVPLYDSIIVSAKAHDEKRDTVVAYTKAFFQATDALQADPDMAAQMLLDWYVANGSESDIESCKAEVDTRPFVTSKEATGIAVGESVRITAEFFASQELITADKLPVVDSHVDGSIVKEALGY